MIVDTVSPTPFSLLRRAKNFEYRDEHWNLQEFANYEDPIKALTDECLRVLKCISSTNESTVSSSKQSTSLRDASWSRFEDIGFGGSIESDPEDEENKPPAGAKSEHAMSLRTQPRSQGGDLGRPTTPSWADFMSSGFSDEGNLKEHVGPLLLPPDKVLPPIAAARGQSSQSHKRHLDDEPALEPAELASINTLGMASDTQNPLDGSTETRGEQTGSTSRLKLTSHAQVASLPTRTRPPPGRSPVRE